MSQDECAKLYDLMTARFDKIEATLKVKLSKDDLEKIDIRLARMGAQLGDSMTERPHRPSVNLLTGT